MVRAIPPALPRPDLVELATLSPTDLESARVLRGCVPLLRWRHVCQWLLLLVAWTLVVAFLLRQTIGLRSAWGGWVLALCLFVTASEWTPWSLPDPRRLRDFRWSVLSGLGAGVICWLASAPIGTLLGSDGSDGPHGPWVIALVGAVLGTVVTHVGQSATRAIRMARREPRPVLTSSPGLAVLLALDSVGEATARQVAEALVLPEALSRDWLQVLGAKGLARARMNATRWRITRSGARVLEEALRRPERSAVNAGH